MGTWGAGNLDNDEAHDILADHSTELIKKTVELLRDPSSQEADETSYAELFVSIELLLALRDRGLLKPYSMPTPKVLEADFRAFLDGWSIYFDELGATKDFKAERRSVIEESFEALLQLSLARHQD